MTTSSTARKSLQRETIDPSEEQAITFVCDDGRKFQVQHSVALQGRWINGLPLIGNEKEVTISEVPSQLFQKLIDFLTDHTLSNREHKTKKRKTEQHVVKKLIIQDVEEARIFYSCACNFGISRLIPKIHQWALEHICSQNDPYEYHEKMNTFVNPRQREFYAQMTLLQACQSKSLSPSNINIIKEYLHQKQLDSLLKSNFLTQSEKLIVGHEILKHPNVFSLTEMADCVWTIYANLDRYQNHAAYFLYLAFTQIASKAQNPEIVIDLLQKLESIPRPSKICYESFCDHYALECYLGRKIALIHDAALSSVLKFQHLSFCHLGQIAFCVVEAFIKKRALNADIDSILKMIQVLPKFIEKLTCCFEIIEDPNFTKKEFDVIKASFSQHQTKEQLQKLEFIASLNSDYNHKIDQFEALTKIQLSINNPQRSIEPTKIIEQFEMEKTCAISCLITKMINTSIYAILSSRNFAVLIEFTHSVSLFVESQHILLHPKIIKQLNVSIDSRMKAEIKQFGQSDHCTNEMLKKIQISKALYKTLPLSRLLNYAEDILSKSFKAPTISSDSQISYNSKRKVVSMINIPPYDYYYMNDIDPLESILQNEIYAEIIEEKFLDAVKRFSYDNPNIPLRNYRFQKIASDMIMQDKLELLIKFMFECKAVSHFTNTARFFCLVLQELIDKEKITTAYRVFIEHCQSVFSIDENDTTYPLLQHQMANEASLLLKAMLEAKKFTIEEHKDLLVMIESSPSGFKFDGTILAQMVENKYHIEALALKNKKNIVNLPAFVRALAKYCGLDVAFNAFLDVTNRTEFAKLACVAFDSIADLKSIDHLVLLNIISKYNSLTDTTGDKQPVCDFLSLVIQFYLQNNWHPNAFILANKLLNTDTSATHFDSTLCLVLDCKWVLFKDSTRVYRMDSISWPNGIFGVKKTSPLIVNTQPSYFINDAKDPQEIISFLKLALPVKLQHDIVLPHLIAKFIKNGKVDLAKELLQYCTPCITDFLLFHETL